ncbi:MAG: nucleoside monophosphate kinase [Candidatus Nomurabacteria bacterium]|nr:MAG: nucleoside monophosphate kinase [Candidatus Nomurabacteria bacterium]
MEPLTLIFIGPQGSGKGTQISKIKSVITKLDPNRKLLDIQTGRLFRTLTDKQDTFAQRKIKTSLSAGVLQPDFLTYVLWGQEMLQELDPDSHLLIDGFPRTVAQAKTLAGAFEFFERKNIHLINLDTPEDIVKERMKSRARADDTPESIESRLRWYREHVLPVIEYYREASNVTVHDIKGDESIEDVHKQVMFALKLN